MNGENRRSREAVRNSIRTYGVKVMDPAALPLNRARGAGSQESVSRFSERSLHAEYRTETRGCCYRCLSSIPYATVLATVVCGLGVLMALAGLDRSATLTNNMVEQFIKQDTKVINNWYGGFLGIIIATIVVGVLILIVGILATGDTRAKVYSKWQARIGGRVSCAILMLFSLCLFGAWLFLLVSFSALCFFLYVANSECEDITRHVDRDYCLQLPMLNFLFPNRKEDVKVCQMEEVKKFCKDYVEKMNMSSAAVEVGIIFILFGLVLYLICLAANYARIRCQSKFQELEEMRHLNVETTTSKDRF